LRREGKCPKGTNMRRILVTGAAGPAGINVINSLRAAGGCYIVAADISRHRLVLVDADRRVVVPRTGSPGYLDALRKVIVDHHIEFVWPQPDGDVVWAAEHEDELGAATLLPPAEVIRLCQDKYRLLALADEARHIMRIATPDDIDEASRRIGRPFWMRATHGAGGRGSTLVESVDTATAWLAYWQSRKSDMQFMAEDYLPGRNIAWESIWHDGELVCSQARERLEYIYDHAAPSGITGSSSVSRLIDDGKVDREGVRIVKLLMRYPHGIFSIDFKEDFIRRPRVTEVNAGRLFTMSMLLTAAGVNFADIHVRLAYGEAIPDVKQFCACGAGAYWVRHMDAPARLVDAGAFPPEPQTEAKCC